MSCPHSTRPEITTCSQCLGVEPSVRLRAVGADEIVDRMRLVKDDNRLSPSDAAAEIGISVFAVYAAIREKRLHATKVGVSWRISREAVAAYREGRNRTPPVATEASP